MVNIRKYGVIFLTVSLFSFSLSNLCAHQIHIDQFWEAVSSDSTHELRTYFDKMKASLQSKSDVKRFLKKLLLSKYADYSLASILETKFARPSRYNFVAIHCHSATLRLLANPIGYIFEIPDIKNHPLLSSYLLNTDIESLDFEQLPGNMVIGAVEMFCGFLLVIIPNPLTKAAGVYLMTDGATRMFDGLEILDEENRKLQKESCAYMQSD